jgi:predicted transcriptional regulator YdeE
MKKEAVSLNGFTLIGISARTNNKDEMNPEASKIAGVAGNYWGNQVANAIQHRLNPGVTYAVYTDYESDEHGEYTYFIGEAVDSLEDQDMSQFATLDIPDSRYEKFTTDAGKMPDIVIASWQAIWQMTENDFGGKRRYVADFEVFDQRAADANNAVIDIYIGVS